MQSLSDTHALPSIFFGDFNEILRGDENEGGVPRCDKNMDDFRICIDNCDVVDLGYRGSCFTWCRGKNPATFVRERLDRFLANPQWVSLFPNSKVRHFPIYSFNHAPILLNTECYKRDEIHHKLFRFETFWLSNDNCREVVTNAWDELMGSTVDAKLENCANALKHWAVKTFGKIKNMIKTTERKLAKAQKQSPDANMIAACETMTSDLDKLHRMEEAYWHMRSRVNELKDGDSNTKYFHHKASSRKKRNLIRGLEDPNGNWLTSSVDIERLITAYFENIFATSSPMGFPEALEGIDHIVSAEMNSVLDEEPTYEEIRTALFQMHPTKAPGMDGFHALFFQKFWDVVGDEIVGLVKNWWRGYLDITPINKTCISLMPKCLVPRSVASFRPISCCNVVYKINF